MTKFMISWNPVISSILDAIAIPNAVKATPIRAMNPNATRNPGMPVIWSPTKSERTRMSRPWMKAVVAPPTVWPTMISRREIGATRVSFRNPNCLSQMI